MKHEETKDLELLFYAPILRMKERGQGQAMFAGVFRNGAVVSKSGGGLRTPGRSRADGGVEAKGGWPVFVRLPVGKLGRRQICPAGWDAARGWPGYVENQTMGGPLFAFDSFGAVAQFWIVRRHKFQWQCA